MPFAVFLALQVNDNGNLTGFGGGKRRDITSNGSFAAAYGNKSIDVLGLV